MKTEYNRRTIGDKSKKNTARTQPATRARKNCGGSAEKRWRRHTIKAGAPRYEGVNASNPIAHLQRLDTLLQQELACEQAGYARSLQESRFASRIAESDCRYPVSLADAAYNALDQLVLTVRYEVDDDLVDNDFEPGHPLAFFYFADDGGSLREYPHQYYIEQAGTGFVSVALPNAAALGTLRALAEKRLLGIRRSIDTTSYRVMHEALSAVMRADNEGATGHEGRLVRLRNILAGNAEPAFRRLPRLSLPWLNATQQEAVQRVVEAEDVAIVHGPPGTGKTTTLIEAIIETLQRETQVMVCAPSNVAVDWISEQLSRRGVNVLRIGNPLRISDEMLDCSYERRFASHPLYSDLWAIRRELHRSPEGKSPSAATRKHLAALRDRATQLEVRIQADIFMQARVVACTLIGSAYAILDRRRFSTLFIDEAAQALEPACWAAIRKCDRVVMGGDHCQLPPTVKSPEALRGGLDRTLMQRVVQAHPRCVTQLDIQYRMHRDIMAFPSRWFYHGRLQAAPAVADRQVTPLDTPLMWIDTSQCGFGERQSRTLSRSNADEARLLIRTLREYIESIGITRVQDERIDFGIISPYRAQVRLIRRLLKLQKFFRRLYGQIAVGTVDGFQGQERDVIILSMVRDNDEGQIGFLRDLRRMNVAMTRARMKLIVLGNAATLSRHPFYAALLDHFQQHGDFLVLPPPEAE